ncbi:histidinol dehydrogenase [Idiomarina aminovorans]|uniref:histidinol dehydrogenase n=1 Tax=Idiomarina aminovorans TaxID=2914829 RepID=UPI002006622E|nr:histidinol dehydrogenase [Idiomarina sp. ATCH4]MCK7460463.1 histidinol dehydrogenase [Idiomarina sp. ATCH4]
MSRLQIPIEQWQSLSAEKQLQRLSRPVKAQAESLRQTVTAILNDVRDNGEQAVLKYTRQFDNPDATSLRLNDAQVDAAIAKLDDKVKRAIDTAYQTIYRFHETQRPTDLSIETAPGVQCELRFAPLDAVGLYIPGGTATLPSTALMLGVPAQIAGCQRVVMTSPPNKQGQLPAALLYAAKLCDVTDILLCGGAQAIGALAYGIESSPAVGKVFGPGNSFVTEAKQQVSQNDSGCAMDLPAGPSELLVIADDSANPAYAAADLLSQAEHGPDSQVILLTPSMAVAEQIREALIEQCAQLSRADIAEQALASSRLLVVTDIDEAIAVSEAYAPEHLCIQTDNARDLLPRLTRAGSIFVGHFTPESGGDYATGTNHVLPTYGYARNYSSLGLADFYRRYTVQEASQKGLRQLAEAITTLADVEGLDAHKRAVTIRTESEL